MIDMVIQDSSYKWMDHTSIHLQDLDITIKCDKLEEVMESAPIDTLPSPYPRMAADIRNEIHHEQEYVPPPSKTKPKREKKKAAPRQDGLISIAQLAQEANLPASKARAILRSNSIPKPEGGWAWTEKEAKAIRKLLS